MDVTPKNVSKLKIDDLELWAIVDARIDISTIREYVYRDNFQYIIFSNWIILSL